MRLAGKRFRCCNVRGGIMAFAIIVLVVLYVVLYGVVVIAIYQRA